MSDERREDELTEDELEETDGEPLPDREALSIVVPDPVHTLPVEPPATE